MALTKMQWLIVGTFLAVAAIIFTASQFEVINIGWNDLVNGLLRDTISVVLGSVFTIIVYRYLYHRKSGR